MLSSQFARYVAFHRGIGLRFNEQKRTLELYAAYAEAHGDRHTRIRRIEEWCATAFSPPRARVWFDTVRRFCAFLNAEDPEHEVPPAQAFGRGKLPRPAPHILENDQIRAIMHAALDLPPTGAISPHTYHHLFGLLATTGLRISEALALQRNDLTDDGLIIRKSKFGKSRLVPIHATTRRALNNYATIRARLKSDGDDLFVVTTGRAPHQTTAWGILYNSPASSDIEARQGHEVRACTICVIPSRCGPSRRAPTIDRRSPVTSPRSAPISVIRT